MRNGVVMRWRVVVRWEVGERDGGGGGGCVGGFGGC